MLKEGLEVKEDREVEEDWEVEDKDEEDMITLRPKRPQHTQAPRREKDIEPRRKKAMRNSKMIPQTFTYKKYWEGDQRPLTSQPFDLTNLEGCKTSVPSKEGPRPKNHT